jgi:hypothetical protein
MKLTEEQIWKCNDDGDGGYHICVAHQNIVEFARAIEREIGFDNADRWIKRIEVAIKDEREACAKIVDAYDVAEDVCSSDTAEGIATAIRARGNA